jgi:alpha-galactosidase
MQLITQFAEKCTFDLNGAIGLISVPTGNVRRGSVKLSMSIADVHSYWHSFMPSVGERIPWTIETAFAAQRGMPFVTFFNTAGINKMAIGLVDCDCDCQFKGKMNQETGCYDISFEISAPDGIKDFSFWFDMAARPWQQEIPLWREKLQNISCDFPASVWQPVFCTWYAVHGAMTQECCNKLAAKAADLGFETFILDDGWCYPDMKRVSPETIRTWYEKIGDWQVDTGKFPDFKGHVEYVQSLGMKYLLWVAPYLIGDHSAMYEKLKDIPGALFGEYLEGYYKLAPENAEAARPMLDLMENLMKEYHLDGLKVDFLDQIHPNIEDPRA